LPLHSIPDVLKPIPKHRVRISRLYTRQPLATGATIELDADQRHYVVRVLRLRIHDALILFDGRGGEHLGKITRSDKNSTIVRLEQYEPVDRESPLRIVLAQGLSRSARMDYTIQKAIELGVNGIQPLLTDHCTVRPDPERSAARLRHWQGLVVSACQQCGRNRLPWIEAPRPFSDWLMTADIQGRETNRNGDGEKTLGVLLDPQAEAAMGQAAAAMYRNIILLMGPEGGFSDTERRAAASAGFRLARIGPRTLRTETASLAAIAALQVLFGDLG